MSETISQPDPHDTDEPVITTKPFAMTPKVYFGIMLRITYWKIWWRIAIIVVFIGYCLFLCCFNDEGVRDSGFLGFSIFGLIALLYLLWPVYSCRNIAYNPANKVVMKTRIMVLSKKRIICNEPENGSVSIHNCGDFFGIEKCRNCHLVWLTPNMMYYLPDDAFQSREDVETFEKEILPSYPEHKRSLINGIFYLVAILVSAIVFGLIISIVNKT